MSITPPSRCILLLLACAAPLGACLEEDTYTSLPGPKPEGCDRPIAYEEADLTADLAYLASPELEGRAPGSAGDVAARAFVAERFACLGLEDVTEGEGYSQPFTDDAGNDTANVLAKIPGVGAGVAGETIVISAHIDHFGDDLLGANDNASGVTALLAIAQDLVNREVRPQRTILFGVFGSEESGFEGSEHFMRRPPAGIDTDRIVYDVNMDMVGSYTASTTLYALGTWVGTTGRQVVSNRTDDHPTLDVTLGYDSDQSDNVSFCSRGVPYIFFWTEDEECYHEACDTSGGIDYDAITEIAALVGEVSEDLADHAGDLAAEVEAGEDVCREPR